MFFKSEEEIFKKKPEKRLEIKKEEIKPIEDVIEPVEINLELQRRFEESKYNPTLDKDLFTNPKKAKTRDGFGEALVKLGEINEDIVALSADLAHSVRAMWFAEKFPERFFQVGIAEANMTGIAAGLARMGKIPFMSTFGVFATGRNWDQVRMSIAYPNMNVKICASHTGIFSVGADGASHQSIEDISLMRVLPNMTVIVPCDKIETRKATFAAAKIKGPVYLRFGREDMPVITTEETPFNVGKAEIFRDGEDVSIIACGPMVYEALLASKKLEDEGIDGRVINNHTVKPIDTETIIKAARETGAIVTAEEHQVIGGIGSAVGEVLGQNYPVPIKMVGVQDRFGESGDPKDLQKAYGLTNEDIIKAVYAVIKMK
ncbi:MAG: transketolase family protein [Candidatus Aenigmarchaeota archaeon]|nr:transketolase family protein [Candidatus Aenigmarchaeota archaeon]